MTDDQPERLGNWLAELVGIGPVCVAIGYQDGYFARRFFQKADARSATAALEWSKRYRRAWLKLNAGEVAAEKASDYLAFAESEDESDDTEESLWRAVVESYSWDRVSHWGPGRPVMDARMERLQLLFITARIVEVTRGAHAAFSYLMGTDRLSGAAPVLSIRLRGRDGAEDILKGAYVHVVEVGSPGGFELTEQTRG